MTALTRSAFHRPENVRKLRGPAVDTVAAGKMECDDTTNRGGVRRRLNTDGQQHRILSDRYADIRQAKPLVKSVRGKAVQATILKLGKAAGAPLMDMLNFLRGRVVNGHVFASGNKHDHDATWLKKFENVSSPERYSPFYLLIDDGLIGVYVMPVASPFYLLIGGGLIDVDMMPLASKLIFAVYLYTKDT
ncbi:hypothetical protein NU104_004271 [Salmonella enterica]|nr:hypothetical protein [Salmonella enterica]